MFFLTKTAVACILSWSLPTVLSQETAPESQPPATPPKVERYRPRQVLLRPVRPIIQPAFVAADKAEVAPGELVIGVVVNGAARAYSINQLTGPQREIINDVLGGTYIAATW